MKKSFILSFIFSCLFVLSANAQISKAQVESGIQKCNNLIAAHDWHEAFATLRSLDAAIGSGNPGLHYLVTKQRYVMYYRINKHAEAKNNLALMENYAMASGDNATIEDMLKVKAGYNAYIGNTQVSRQCYKTIFDRRAKGKDDDGVEQCFKQLIAEAKQGKNNAMVNVIQGMYTTWQDSIASERSASELRNLKKEHAASLEEISDKEGTIAGQWALIVVLIVIAVGLGLGLAFFVLTMFRNISTIKKLRNSLDIVTKSNEQKSVFIRNISGQIAPSLDQIAKGNVKEHVPALQRMLQHAEEYMEIESTMKQPYETEGINVAKLCDEIATSFKGSKAPITTDATSMTFPLNKDAVTTLLKAIIGEIEADANTERITLAFKKRNPHTSQFVVTGIGMKIDEADRESLFTAFSKIYDLTVTDGLTLPTCALMACKMGGQLTLDESFAKGTRFVLEIHS